MIDLSKLSPEKRAQVDSALASVARSVANSYRAMEDIARMAEQVIERRTPTRRSPPMSKVELVRRLTNRPAARLRDGEQLLEFRDLRHEGGKLWTIALNGLDPDTIKRILEPRA